MSDFRKHVEAARTAHRSVRYPGNLSAEVLPRTPVRGWLFPVLQGGIVAAAVAAVVFLAVWLSNAPTEIEPPSQTAEIVPQDREEIFVLSSFPALEIPQLPGDFSMTLETPSFAAPMPDFPAMDTSDSSTSTSREAL